MKRQNYKSMNSAFEVNRRTFLKSGSLVGAGIVLGTPVLWAQDKASEQEPSKPETNIKDVLKIERTETSMPGKFPGKVVKVADSNALVDNVYNAEIIQNMFEKGMQSLSGKDLQQTFDMLFTKDDIIGIKVNPVGGGLISTRLELVDSIVKWLTDNGMPKNQIIIWDRFDFMLRDGGFTQERFPGIGIEALQTADEEASKNNDNSKWLDADGNHTSLSQFDKNVYYYADVEAPQDLNYLNQHVVNTKYSYFGKLLTQKLTKIINVPVFKNTGNGISMATKNIGYAAICNTGRLHRPLFFDVCTEVLAFPCVRDKMVLNITDGLRAQYDGGPGPNAGFVYDYNTLFFATDAIALDMTCHNILVQKRKEMKVDVNEHPKYTEYLRYAQELQLGSADLDKIILIEA
ncbi:MAG: DUF362 domain-containing protein [Calditrichaceae bacterium]